MTAENKDVEGDREGGVIEVITTAQTALKNVNTLALSLQSLLNGLEASGKIHADISLALNALSGPINISIDIQLPPSMPLPQLRQIAHPEFVTTFSGLYHELGNPRAPEDQQKKMSATIADQPNKHPVMWGILQHHCLHEYFKANPAVSAIDWQSIRDWLKTNWPQIISAICSIIMLFILLGVEREIASDL